MHRSIITIGAWALLASAAVADQVSITNQTDGPIYRIYAWPAALSARTFNILPTPLFPDSTADIDVDNSYGDCDFTFEYDPNDPEEMKRPGYRKKPLGTFETNICVAKDKVSIKSAAFGG